MLEAESHEHRAFVTLTYNNENLPNDGELVPRHLTNFFKRLRKRLALEGRSIRYFACGEYGEKNSRPHYHAIIFGLAETEATAVSQTWPFGSVHVGSVTSDSIQYVCGYVLKKNLKKERGDRTVSEFSRQSLRPGIGAGFPVRAAYAMSSQDLYPLTMQLCGDVPSQVRINGKMWPIGRYLKNKLRKEVGLDEDEVKRINKELQRQITKEKIREAEESDSLKTEVLRLKKSLDKRTLTRDEYKKAVMELYNRSTIERSEKLSQIYQKERTLDADIQTIQTRPQQ
ncbi:MAG: replication associated protein [Microviridae sp. ctzVR26]|nr:MAG: replication associated protein [Microviridae sp. ctzVR26]